MLIASSSLSLSTSTSWQHSCFRINDKKDWIFLSASFAAWTLWQLEKKRRGKFYVAYFFGHIGWMLSRTKRHIYDTCVCLFACFYVCVCVNAKCRFMCNFSWCLAIDFETIRPARMSDVLRPFVQLILDIKWNNLSPSFRPGNICLPKILRHRFKLMHREASIHTNTFIFNIFIHLV